MNLVNHSEGSPKPDEACFGIIDGEIIEGTVKVGKDTKGKKGEKMVTSILGNLGK